ncbi:hypothetical protein SNE40_018933 [Patella caerulea]|uniref:Integrase catalytic domain-containing protein n=1 Tax=Patella caerulea TaxID=87958 RepID=A0AAN8J8Z5_PATCE
MCKSCNICQTHQAKQQPEPLLQTEIPTRPWSIIGTDLFQIDNKQYLIICDYFTKFPIIECLPSPAPTEVVADITRKYCSIMGIPDIIRSDNGPRYVGHAYPQFTRTWNIQHITSSPHYARSNGFIERQIETCKHMKKARAANEDIQLALLRWRTTPVDNKITSFAEVMFQRKVKDTLPSKINYSSPANDAIRLSLRSRQDSQKAYHDRKCKELPPLYTHQHVS